MVLVEVRAPHVYDDRTRRVGECYEADEQFLPLMTTLGWVVLPQTVVVPHTASHPEDDETTEQAVESKRRYRRKVMVAEPTD